MKETIYYADLTPCDNMQDYKVAVFVPQFVTDDTNEFDIDPPMSVVQLATKLGWCIIAKWGNNGSTRIYAKDVETLKNGVEILSGICDSGDCNFYFGEEKISSKLISEEDMSVFYGYTEGNIIEGMMREEECTGQTIDTSTLNVHNDNVNHPQHYTWLKELCGIEVIDITRHMNFCLGCALKYILRAGHKKDASLTDTDKQIEDLNKAIWYLKDEIKRITDNITKE